MKNKILILSILFLGLILIPAYSLDDVDVSGGFSSPNVLSLDIEEDALNNNPAARGNLRIRFLDPLYISSDTFTSGGAIWSISADVASVDAGTANGQLLFWNNATGIWEHTETTEMAWDDINKSLYVSGLVQAQGSFTAGDADTAGWLKIEDGDGESWTWGINNRVTNAIYRMPDEDAGPYDGRISFPVPVAGSTLGTWAGDKQHFFGGLVSPVSADIFVLNGMVAYSTTIGIVTMRPGTITGISASGLVVGAGADGVDIEVWLNGVAILGACKVKLTQGTQSNFATFIPGINNFGGGDELQIYANFQPPNPATSLATLMVDVEYQTR